MEYLRWSRFFKDETWIMFTDFYLSYRFGERFEDCIVSTEIFWNDYLMQYHVEMNTTCKNLRLDCDIE